MEKGALDGVPVLELGARVSAGVCGSVLAQLGATVILAEGLPHRAGAPKWDRRAQAALGKLSLHPDLSDPDERELLARLVARADVVLISSDVDGVLQTLPEGWREGRIVCDFTAYGASGPLAGRPDGEAQIQAVTGIIDTTGSSDSAPVLVPLPVVETMTGLYGASGVIAALRVARLTGRPQSIDMSLYDCAFAGMATFLPRIGVEGAPERIGNNHAMISPWNVFQARDGWVLVCAGTDMQWQRLCGVMGREDLATDPRYERIADPGCCAGWLGPIRRPLAGQTGCGAGAGWCAGCAGPDHLGNDGTAAAGGARPVVQGARLRQGLAAPEDAGGAGSDPTGCAPAYAPLGQDTERVLASKGM